MSTHPQPYNPLDRVELGKSVERALLAQPLSPLPPLGRFGGAGLYAIYYVGEFSPYAEIAPPARAAGEVPIYVGRARPRGARQGVVEGLDVTTPEPVLFSRLREHANSIRTVETYHRSKDASNLKLHDFRCRYLVADDIWVPLGEALLIGHYRPVWNVVVDGFGNHAPGGGREQQARSLWDELHPGRSWAERLPSAALTVPKIMTRVKQHLGSVGAPDLSITPPLGADVQHAQANESEEEEQSTLPFE